MKNRTHHELGFTLIELMVVLAVFGVLVASTAPFVGGYLRSSQLSGIGDGLEGDMRQARAAAVAQRRTVEVRFASGGYSAVQPATLTTLFNRTLPTGFVCAATDTATFFPWGLASPVAVTLASHGDTTTVRLTSNGKVTRD